MTVTNSVPNLPPGGHDTRNNIFAVILAVIVLGAGAVLSTAAAEIIRSAGAALIVVSIYVLILWFFWPHRSKRMASFLLLATIIFAGLSAASLVAWRLVNTTHTVSPQATASAIAHLAKLGWTVRPGADLQFEVSGRALPPMQESARYFAKLGRPFTLNFQQVVSLNGLHFLSDISECTQITISAGEFTDLSELSAFTHLTNLVISQLPLNGNGIVDTSPLASLTSLQSLSLNMVKTRSIDGLQNLTKLRNLNIGGTFVSDISVLANFSVLETLEVRDTRVTDLTPLSRDHLLREIVISGTQLSGLSALANLPSLKKITLIEQQPFNLSAFSALPNIETLWIWAGSSPLDVAPLGTLKKIQSLTITGGAFALTPVSHIEVVGRLTTLTSLTLGYLQVADIDFVGGLKNLTAITLNSMPVTTIASFANLTALKTVALANTSIVDVSPLLSLPNLTDLTVGRTPARSDVISELGRRGVKVTSW